MITDSIKTENGLVSGTTVGDKVQEARIYRGIPYAAPPVGPLRWKPPQPTAPWKGSRDCTNFSCITPQLENFGPTTPIEQNEDCLYLNIVTPAKKVSGKLPVMVWMHGGGFTGGHGNEKLFCSARLANHGVVLVTVNMRLEAIGLLCHPLLSKESPQGVSGNYMFLDMIASLKWVQKNIEAFGGDPDNVTIFGESGGGAKVALLMASPLAKGLFHRAILESAWNPTAGAITGKSLKQMEDLGEKLFAKLSVNKEADPLKAARALPVQKVLEANFALSREEKVLIGVWDEAVDGWFLPDNPLKILSSDKYNAVPFIAGGNLGEATDDKSMLFLPHMIPIYVEMFKGAEKTKTKAYAYIFNRVPDGRKKSGIIQAPHGIELSYVFGDYDNTSGWWNRPIPIRNTGNTRSAPPPAPPKPIDPELNEADKKVSEAMMTMWAQFAKTGNPSVRDLIYWPPWSRDTDKYLYIADPMVVKLGFSKIKKQ
jgi:para-nitrobenzyl esterase